MYISYVRVDLLRHPTMAPASMKSLISLAFAISVTFVRAEPAIPIVNLGYATYEGVVNATTNNTEFLGMRFAAPPTGNLYHLSVTVITMLISLYPGAFRWQAPQAPATVEGVQQAFVRPMSCFNAGEGIAPTAPFPGPASFKRATAVSSEDCLFLRYTILIPRLILSCSQGVSVVTPGLPSKNTQKKLPVVVWIHGYISPSFRQVVY